MTVGTPAPSAAAVPSFVSGASSEPLLYRTVDGVLKAAAARYHGRLALAALAAPERAERYTFAELDAEVEACARGLVALGLKPGERIGIWAPNRGEWVLTMFAAARAGLILVNINPAYRSSELEFALRLVGCRALVFAPSFKGTDYFALLREIIPELATAERGLLHARGFPELRLLIELGSTAAPGCLTFGDMRAAIA